MTQTIVLKSANCFSLGFNQDLLDFGTKINIDDDFDMIKAEYSSLSPQQNLDESSESSPIASSSKKIKKCSSNKASNIQKASSIQKRTPWRSWEDAKVLELVEKLGRKWTEIGTILGNRTGKQVRERYLYTISPEINKAEWTEEEDLILMSNYGIYKNQWGQIAKELPGRTENQIKNRVNSKLKKGLSLADCDYSSPSTTQPSSVCNSFLSMLDVGCYFDQFKRTCDNFPDMSVKEEDPFEIFYKKEEDL